MNKTKPAKATIATTISRCCTFTITITTSERETFLASEIMFLKKKISYTEIFLIDRTFGILGKHASKHLENCF